MKTSLEYGPGFSTEMQPIAEEGYIHNIVAFPGFQFSCRQRVDRSPTYDLLRAVSRSSQTSARWEGASYLTLGLAAVLAVTISLIRAWP